MKKKDWEKLIAEAKPVTEALSEVQEKIVPPLQEWLGRILEQRKLLAKHLPSLGLPVEIEIQQRTLEDVLSIIHRAFGEATEKAWLEAITIVKVENEP